MSYSVFYARPAAARDLSMGMQRLSREIADGRDVVTLDIDKLDETHVMVRQMDSDSGDDMIAMGEIFYAMQGEVWSPNGEQNGLIRSLGLSHTSMSIGDVIVTEIGQAYMIEPLGYCYLGIIGGTRKHMEMHRS